eukprot:gene3922-4886_t
MTNLILGENIRREHSCHGRHNIFTVKADASFAGKQHGEYILIDLGTDGVTFEKPHLWKAFVNAVRNFTHGEHIMFFRGASTIPGIVATMESDERGHREDRRLADRHATHLVVLEKSVPVLLRNRAFKNKDTFAHSLPSYPIVFLQLACELISVEFEDDPCNFYLYPSRIHGFDFISMNLNATGKVATELRVSKFRLLIRAENSRNFFHSLLDLVRKYSDDIVELTFNVDDPTDPVDGNASPAAQHTRSAAAAPAAP